MAKRASKKKAPEGSTRLADAKQELFCITFTGYEDRELFGNATKSFMEVFGYNQVIEKMRDEIEGLLSNMTPGYLKAVENLERQIKSKEAVARSSASRLLTKANIRARINHLMDLLSNEKTADRELTYTFSQRKDLNAKVAALREFNRLKARVSDKLEGEFVFQWGEPEKPKK